jgi:hypothetical protein
MEVLRVIDKMISGTQDAKRQEPQLYLATEGQNIFPWLYSPCRTWSLLQFLNLYTFGRAPWTGDRLVARPLPTHRTTQGQNKEA